MTEHREDHADRHGYGGPDELDLTGYPGVDESLWEEVTGDLHPIDEPSSFTVTADAVYLGSSGGAVTVEADANLELFSLTGDATLEASAGTLNVGRDDMPTYCLGDPLVLGGQTAATADGDLQANTWSMHINEAADVLTFKAKYADGTTIMVGEIPLFPA